MRVAIVSESFLPQVNGVSNSVRHVVNHLLDHGHQVLVVAPGPGLRDYRGARVVRVRSMGLPGYRSFNVGLPDAAVERALAEFRPDVVHLASPALLGATGLRAARKLGVPTVAVYQTDLSGFARQYGVRADPVLDRFVAGLHKKADRTLVPSTSALHQLEGLGVPDLHLWRRGVSLDLFDPRLRDERAARALGQEPRVRRPEDRRRLRRAARRREAGAQPRHRREGAGHPDGGRRRRPRARLARAPPRGRALHRPAARGEPRPRLRLARRVRAHRPDRDVLPDRAGGPGQRRPGGRPGPGGPVDLVEDGVTGLLYDPDDPRALRRTVARAVGDPALRKRLARNALLGVEGRTWDQVVAELVEVHYAGVLDRTGRAAA